jgi:hypothetical protein
MTTQPHFTEANGSSDRDQYAEPAPSDAVAEVSSPTQPLHRDEIPHRDEAAEPVATPAQPLDRDRIPQTERPVEQPQSRGADAGSSTEDSLFAPSDLSGLRSRWDDVQAGFVDDPRKCVQTADGLVSDTVEQLTNNFSQARSRLEEQWARGEDVSTEDLRLALKRYREFFDRLLAV